MAQTRIDPPLRAGILGATGAVGQRFIALLAEHPGFIVQRLGASSRSAGRSYAEAAVWRMNSPLPDAIGQLVVTECVPAAFDDCDVIFSGLDASVAGDIELAFLAADHCVLSNAKNHRTALDVPLVVPTVNHEHLHAITAQRLLRGLQRGFLVTNANCSTTGLVVALQALQQGTHYGQHLRQVNVVTMQAISGAGYPGVSAMDITDNVVPYISGEEDKVETEPLKILGQLSELAAQVHSLVAQGDLAAARALLPNTSAQDSSVNLFTPLPDCIISASCNRVPVIDGHTACVSVGFDTKHTDNMDGEALSATAMTALAQYRPPVGSAEIPCHSAPVPAIRLHTAPDRPQPRLDRDLSNGYTVSVGRVRPCPVLDLKFTVLSHNTVLGAAGSGILNAEAAYAMGYITRRQ